MIRSQEFAELFNPDWYTGVKKKDSRAFSEQTFSNAMKSGESKGYLLSLDNCLNSIINGNSAESFQPELTKLRKLIAALASLLSGDYKYQQISPYLIRTYNHNILDLSIEPNNFGKLVDDYEKGNEHSKRDAITKIKENFQSQEKAKKEFYESALAELHQFVFDSKDTGKEKFDIQYKKMQQHNYCNREYWKILKKEYNVATSKEFPGETAQRYYSSQDLPAKDLKEKLPEWMIYRIEYFKLLRTFTGIRRGLNRIEIDMKMIQLDSIKSDDDRLIKSVLNKKAPYETDEKTSLDIETQSQQGPSNYMYDFCNSFLFLWEFNKTKMKDELKPSIPVHDHFQKHKEYVDYYSLSLEMLDKMLEIKTTIKHQSKLTEQEENDPDKGQKDFFTTSNIKILKDHLQTIKDLETKQHPQKSSPYRSATIILPVGKTGGMAAKIWLEERSRFEFICNKRIFQSDYSVQKKDGEIELMLLLQYYDQLIKDRGNTSLEKDMDVTQNAIFEIMKRFE